MPLSVRRYDAAPRPRWKPMPQPHALERSYYATLLAVVERTFAVLRRKLAPHLPPEATRQDAAGDETPDNGAAVTFTIEEVEVELATAFPATTLQRVAARTAGEIDTAHLSATRRQFAEATGVNILQEAPKLRPTVEEFTKRNVALIKSIPQEAMEGLRHALVEAGLEKGFRPERLAKVLEERYGIAQRRAQLIATDQVGKMMSSLTEERHRDLGITKYRWRTVRDNRVRRRHAKREGVVFSYDDPPNDGPDDGHPGTPIRCRCWSEPLLDEVLPVQEALEVERTTTDPAPAEAEPASAAPVESIAVVVKRAEKVAAEQAKKTATPTPSTKKPAAPGRPESPKPAPRAPGAPNPVAVAQALVKPKAPVPSPLKAQVKPPAKVRVPATVSTTREVSPAQAAQPIPVDRAKTWKASRVYLVPIEELADVPAKEWNGRGKSIRKAYEAGQWEDLPPIMVITENKATGARELDDGNHRLAVAREMGARFIAVRFGDREAAGLRARPPNPGLPWFIREDPERFGYRLPSPPGK